MKRYRVILEVVYPIIVEADNKEEAIELAMDKCPYDNVDNADEVEPIVKEIEDDE